MRIGLMLPSVFSLHGPGNGVRVQAWRQADALERLGHTVLRLDPWEASAAEELDVLHFFLGGFATHTIETLHPHPVRMLSFATMIDSNESNRRYRWAARIGGGSRLRTTPGEYRRQALASNVVIVRSEHERARVVDGLGVDPARVEIVLNGVDPPPTTDAEAVRTKLDLPDRFVLHVSAYTQARKNVVKLIEAVGPTGHPLIIAGTAVPGPTLDHLKRLEQQYDNVRLMGYVDEETLHGLYAACDVFALPTTHEGTGLVALEAAAHGARIVITKNGGPPDYFLGMAEYVDPHDTEDIRKAVLRAWDAPSSDQLKDHVLSNLTWDQSAASLVEAWRKHMPEGA